jgi:single-stranded DNA-binding protein
MAKQSFNIFSIKGNLGADAELKTYGPKNLQVCEFSLAGNMSRNDHLVWFKCNMYRQAAQIAEVLKKGMGVIVSGQLEIYPNPDGTLKHSITIDRVEIVSYPQQLAGNYNQQPQPQPQPSQQPGNMASGFDPFAAI